MEGQGLVAGLLEPGAVAIVGASPENRYAVNVMGNLLLAGLTSEQLLLVNPGRSSVGGVPCHSSLADLPRPVGLVAVATPAASVAGIAKEAVAIGARGLVVFSGGFAEQGVEGQRRQAELTAVAEDAGIAVVGPNTLGFVAPPEGIAVWGGSTVPLGRHRRGLGLVFHSSGMLNCVMKILERRGVGVRGAFSLGNEVTVDAADVIDFYVDDDSTRVIVAMLESSLRPRRLLTALRRAQAAGKPVVMLKVGQSERARMSALAHSGRLVSSRRAWDAMVERLGITIAKDLDELTCVAVALDQFIADRSLAGKVAEGGDVGERGAAVASISGGDCGLLADVAEEVGLRLVGLSDDGRHNLEKHLGAGKFENPLDVGGWLRNHSETTVSALEVIASDLNVEIVGYRFHLPGRPNDRAEKLYTSIIHAVRAAGAVPIFLTRANDDEFDRSWYDFFESDGVCLLPSFRPGLRALAACLSWRPVPNAGEDVAIEAIPEAVRMPGTETVARWSEGQDVLESIGIPYAPATLVQDPDQAARAAMKLGFPVAVKLVSMEVVHKAAAGFVVTGCDSETEVEVAAGRMLDESKRRGIETEGVEIQAMIPGGVEMMLAARDDPVLGPVVMAGFGGTMVEIFDDVSVAMPRISARAAERLLMGLRGAGLLTGAHGTKRDVQALAEALCVLADFAVSAGPDLVSLDLNPIMVLAEGDGVVAVDSVLVRSGNGEPDDDGTGN